jgi:hypothetical protein
VERLGKRRLRARFDATFVPLMLTVRLDVGETWVDDIPYLGAYAYECRLRTTVPACLPDLELSAERLWHTVEKAVGLAREPQLGDVPFDRAFWVRGDPNVARGLLVPEVREELLCLGWRKPHLLLESGSLDVAWWGESDRVHTGDLASSVRAAVATVLGMRAVIDRVGAGSR